MMGQNPLILKYFVEITNHQNYRNNYEEKLKASFRDALSNIAVNLFLKSIHATPNFVAIKTVFLHLLNKKLIRFLGKFLLYGVEYLCKV